MSEFTVWSHSIQARTESALQGYLPPESISPQRLHKAMRFSVLNGGKRVRALLAHAAGEFCGAKPEKIDTVASAVELIHAYSLVHDDMPCMDDDDLRRGKPSCHKQFDDATALLVGDALQSLAFDLLSMSDFDVSASQKMAMTNILAKAAGSRGMAGGQAIDLASVGLELSQEQLEFMHIHKTGALIRAAVLLGAYCSEQPEQKKIEALDHYAKHIGLAFQVVDDILDSQADTATLGKTAGKDALANKPTYVTILGLVRARELAQELHQNAISKLGAESTRLTQLALYITQRSH